MTMPSSPGVSAHHDITTRLAAACAQSLREACGSHLCVACNRIIHGYDGDALAHASMPERCEIVSARVGEMLMHHRRACMDAESHPSDMDAVLAVADGLPYSIQHQRWMLDLVCEEPSAFTIGSVLVPLMHHDDHPLTPTVMDRLTRPEVSTNGSAYIDDIRRVWRIMHAHPRHGIALRHHIQEHVHNDPNRWSECPKHRIMCWIGSQSGPVPSVPPSEALSIWMNRASDPWDDDWMSSYGIRVGHILDVPIAWVQAMSDGPYRQRAALDLLGHHSAMPDPDPDRLVAIMACL
jgi:hypothetical protein